MKAKSKNNIRRIIDAVLTVILLCLMAFQVTGEMAHEWLGIGMTVLVILHQILNIKWYGALFKGKYRTYRIIQTAVNILLLLSFAATAFSGMAMSGYAVPFLYGMAKVSLARRVHLSLSHWTFVLMAVHLGLHIPAMTAKMNLSDNKRRIVSAVFSIIAGAGLFFFLKNGIYNYLFFSVPFAFLDYGKSALLVFSENILILLFWAFIGTQCAVICKAGNNKKSNRKNILFPILMILISVLVGSTAFAAAGI